MNKTLKVVIKYRSLFKIFSEISIKPAMERNKDDTFWVALYIAYTFLRIMQCFINLSHWKTGIKQLKLPLQKISAVAAYVSLFFCAALSANCKCYSVWIIFLSELKVYDYSRQQNYSSTCDNNCDVSPVWLAIFIFPWLL